MLGRKRTGHVVEILVFQHELPGEVGPGFAAVFHHNLELREKPADLISARPSEAPSGFWDRARQHRDKRDIEIDAGNKYRVPLLIRQHTCGSPMKAFTDLMSYSSLRRRICGLFHTVIRIAVIGGKEGSGCCFTA